MFHGVIGIPRKNLNPKDELLTFFAQVAARIADVAMNGHGVRPPAICEPVSRLVEQWARSTEAIQRMNKRSFTARRLVGVVCAIASSGVLGSEARASGYLPCTGPVPLRFESEKPPPKPLALPVLIMDEPPPAPPDNETPAPAISEDVTSAPVPEAPPSPTSAAAESPAPDSAAALLGQLYGGDGSNPFAIPAAQIPAQSVAEAPASNLLVVTPQMLVDYFKAKPVAGAASNTTSVAVFAPVGFTPPAPVGLPSSQATYRSQ